MKRKFKLNNFNNPTNISKTYKRHMMFGNPGPGLGQTYKCGSIKPVIGIPMYHLKKINLEKNTSCATGTKLAKGNLV